MRFTFEKCLMAMTLGVLAVSAVPASAQISNAPSFGLAPGVAYRSNSAYDSINQVYLVIVQRPPVTGRFYNKFGQQIGSDFVISNEPGYVAWVSVAFGGPANDPGFLVTYVMAAGGNPKFGRLVRYVGGAPSVGPPSWIVDVTSEWVYQEKAQSVWNGQQFIVGSRVMNPGAVFPTFQVNHFNMNGAVSLGVNLGDGLDYYGSPALACATNGTCLAVGYMAGVPTGYSGGWYGRRFDAASLAPLGPLAVLDSGVPNEDQGVVYVAHANRFLTEWFRGGGPGVIQTRIVFTDGSMAPLDLNRGIGPEAGTNSVSYNPATQTTLLLMKSSGAALLAMELGDDGYPRNPGNILLQTPWDGLVLDYHPSIAADSADGRWLVSWTMQNGGFARLIQGNAPSGGPNPVQNGDFSGGLSNWQIFALPSQSVAATINSGVLEFYRTPSTPIPGNQGVILQPMNVGLPANSPVAAGFDLGNSSNQRKRMTVLLHDADFSDLHVCTFWLEPFSPMRHYAMRTHSKQAWANLTVSFYAATEGSDGGAYRLDNVSVSFPFGQSIDRTDCVDPTVPAPPGGADGANIIANGTFNQAFLSWNLFGQISASMGGGAFRFTRPAGTPAGAVLQLTNVAHAANTRLTATFDLGNSSPVRKRVTAVLHDSNYSDLAACTFWLDAGQALTPFTMRVFAKRAWANATVSFYLGAVDTQTWALIDNVTMRQTPSSPMYGTECISDAGASGASASTVPAEAGAASDAVARFSPSAMPRSPRLLDPQVVGGGALLPEEWLSTGANAVLDRGRRSVWRSVVSDGETNQLAGTSPIDLRQVSSAHLSFASWRPNDAGAAEVQVSTDGLSWTSIAQIAASSSTWDAVDVALDEFVGQLVFLRLVHTSQTTGSQATWWVTNIRVYSAQ